MYLSRIFRAVSFLFLSVALIGMVMIAWSWSSHATTGATSTVNVRVHDAENAEPETMYCKFTIVDELGNGPHSEGDTLCVVCGYDECPAERILITEEGVEYFVEIELLMSCVTCQGVDLNNFYENR